MVNEIISHPEKQVGEAKSDSVQNRRYISVKDIDARSMDDIKGMFGMWFEADHCDKD